MFFLNAVTEVHTFSLSGKLFHNTAHLYLTVLFLYDVFGEAKASSLKMIKLRNLGWKISSLEICKKKFPGVTIDNLAMDYSREFPVRCPCFNRS